MFRLRYVSVGVLVSSLFVAAVARAETPAAEGDWFSLATEMHQMVLGLNGANNRPGDDGARAVIKFKQDVLALHQKHIGEQVGDEAYATAVSRLPNGVTEDHAYERHALLLHGLNTASYGIVHGQGGDAFTVAALSILSTLNLLHTDLPKLTAEHRALSPREGQLSSKEAGRLLDVRSKMASLRRDSNTAAVFALGELLGGSRNFSFGAPKRPSQGFFAKVLRLGR